MTIALSVRSLDCSPDTVESNIDSGVSMASRSSTLVPEEPGSSVDWTCSAFSWASATFASASSINFFRTSWIEKAELVVICHSGTGFLYLNRTNVGILCSVLVLIQSIFCQFTLLEVDTELDKLHHDRLKGCDGTVTRSFRSDMFV